MSLTLTPMTQDEFDTYKQKSLTHLAHELAKARDLNDSESTALARQSFNSLFPNGHVNDPDQFLFVARRENTVVGTLHFGMRRDRNTPYLYIWDIAVDPAERGNGYGRQLMRFAERWAEENELQTVRLNVFGHNHVATQLYLSLGYTVESSIMVKTVATP